MPGLALGVEAPPAHPAAQVGGIDRVEPALGVDVLDARADVEPVVVALRALVRVQRLAVSELPLALAALGLGRGAVGGKAVPPGRGADAGLIGRAGRWVVVWSGAGAQIRRQSALLTRRRSTWRRATRRRVSADDPFAGCIGAVMPQGATWPVSDPRASGCWELDSRHAMLLGPSTARPIHCSAHPLLGADPAAGTTVAEVPFGIYVHVPFCAARCGYCDFNTYTPTELAGSGASPDGWLEAVRRELDLAARRSGGGRSTRSSSAVEHRRCSGRCGWAPSSTRSARRSGSRPAPR